MYAVLLYQGIWLLFEDKMMLGQAYNDNRPNALPLLFICLHQMVHFYLFQLMWQFKTSLKKQNKKKKPSISQVFDLSSQNLKESDSLHFCNTWCLTGMD